jgi:hypothetical protein
VGAAVGVGVGAAVGVGVGAAVGVGVGATASTIVGLARKPTERFALALAACHLKSFFSYNYLTTNGNTCGEKNIDTQGL